MNLLYSNIFHARVPPSASSEFKGSAAYYYDREIINLKLLTEIAYVMHSRNMNMHATCFREKARFLCGGARQE